MPRQTFPVLEESIHCCIGRDTRRHVWISTRVQSLNIFVHPKSFLTNNNFPQLRNKKKFQLLHVLKTWKTKLNAITQHFVVSFSVTTSVEASIGNFKKGTRSRYYLWLNREEEEEGGESFGTFIRSSCLASLRNRVESDWWWWWSLSSLRATFFQFTAVRIIFGIKTVYDR